MDTLIRLESGEIVYAHRKDDGMLVTSPYTPLKGTAIAPVSVSGLNAVAAISALTNKLNEIIIRLNSATG